jgi:glycosyltransferase involved in cell wall biosynthesis
MAITVVTPFSRRENLELMANHLKGKCNWVVLINEDIQFPDWVTVKRYEIPELPQGACRSNWLFNKYIEEGLDDETQYMILCDDDHVEEGYFDKIPNEDVVVTSMHRGLDVLIARRENMSIGRVGGEQVIVKGKILKHYRYGLSPVGDGEMIEQMFARQKFTYVPDAYVLFNYLEDGRHLGFRRKPLVLFVGDAYCAGNPNMGKSEWESNIASSLDSSGVADVVTFNFDKYYFHTGRRGDEALLERIDELKPDYVVLIIYKEPASDPTVISEETISKINVPIISIWGDLEASEQVDLAKSLEKYMYKVVGTANKSVVEGLGYTYMHVPKDHRIFNNPNKERDIDVLFNGSFGYGREERREVLQYLLDKGIKLVAGGSEGGDHFTTEEYADRYKRAKIAISFSQARGMNVVNARPFEAMSCGAMLLEQKSEELAKLYTEGIDYDVWITKEDLYQKICYYLEHERERESIASAGCTKTQELYSDKTFWEQIIK